PPPISGMPLGVGPRWPGPSAWLHSHSCGRSPRRRPSPPTIRPMGVPRVRATVARTATPPSRLRHWYVHRPITNRSSIIQDEVIILGLIRFTGIRREHLAHLWPRATRERTRLDREGTRAVPIRDAAPCRTIPNDHSKPGGRGIERQGGVRDPKDDRRAKGKLLAAHLRRGVRRVDVRGIIATTTAQKPQCTAEHEDCDQAYHDAVRPLHAVLSFWLRHGIVWHHSPCVPPASGCR